MFQHKIKTNMTFQKNAALNSYHQFENRIIILEQIKLEVVYIKSCATVIWRDKRYLEATQQLAIPAATDQNIPTEWNRKFRQGKGESNKNIQRN